MKKVIILIFIIIGLLISDMSSNILQKAQDREFRDPLINSDYKGVSLYIDEVTKINKEEFSNMISSLSKEYELAIFFKPNSSSLIKEPKHKIFYYTLNSITEDYLNIDNNKNKIVSSFTIEGATIIETIKKTDGVSYYPLNMFQDDFATTSGIMTIIHKEDIDVINQVTVSLSNELGTNVSVLFEYDSGTYRLNTLSTIIGSLDLNYTVIYIALLMLLLLAVYYCIAKTRRTIIIKKSLGYSSSMIIKDIYKEYLLYPLLVAYALFPVYLLVLAINFNYHVFSVFKLYSLGFICIIVLLVIGLFSVYISCIKASKVELLKGRVSSNHIKSGFFVIKLLLIPVLLITSFWTLNSNESYDYYSRKKSYYDNNLNNYQVLSVVKGNSLYSWNDMNFYNKMLNELEHEGIFGLGMPIYISNNEAQNSTDYYRIDVTASTLDYLDIKAIDGSDITLDDYTKDAVLISENMQVNNEFLEELAVNNKILYVQNKELPNIYAYDENYNPTLDRFILYYYVEPYYSLESIIADTNIISEKELILRLDEACNSMKIENVFEFKDLSYSLNSQFIASSKQAIRDYYSLIPIIAIYLLISLLVNYVYFNEKKKRLAIERIHGYSKLLKYRSIIILNGVIILLASIITLILKEQLSMIVFNKYIEQYNNSSLMLIMFGLLLFIVDVIVVFVNLEYHEKKSIKEEKKG